MVPILLIAAAALFAVATLLQLRWANASAPTLQRVALVLLGLGAASLVGAAVVEFSGEQHLLSSAAITLVVAAGGTVGYMALRPWREMPLSPLVVASLASVTALAIYLKGFDPPSAGNGMSALTAVHVGSAMLGFAAFVPAYVLSLLFLSQEHRLKNKLLAGAKMPSLMTLETRSWQLLYVGFPLYTVGVGLGIFAPPATPGAGSVWLRPQHLLAAISWAVYAFAIYRRWTTGWRGRRAALAIIGAFVTTFGAVLMYMMR